MKWIGLSVGMILIALVTSIARADAPYVLTLIAEKASADDAFRIRKEFKKIDPFSRMGDQFVIKIKVIDTSSGCKKVLGPSGFVNCDDDHLRYMGTAPPFQSNAVMVLPNLTPFRSSAGSVVHLDPKVKVTTAVHEFMHLLGFGDEYAYTEEREPKQLQACGDLKGHSLNTAVLLNAKATYISNEEARKLHSKQVNWIDAIPTSAPLTSEEGGIGTWSANPEFSTPDLHFAPGLFRSEDCKGARVLIPYPNTIMSDDYNAFIPPLYKEMIVRQMNAARGIEIRIQPPLNVACLNKLTTQDVEGIPEMHALTPELQERLRRVFPASTNTLPSAFLKTFPEIGTILESFKRESPVCFAALPLQFHEDGSLTFGDPSDDKPRNKDDYLFQRSFGKLTFAYDLGNALQHKGPPCAALAAKFTNAIYDQYPLVPAYDLAWRAVWGRAQGKGEPALTWQRLLREKEPGEARNLTRRLLGESLYNRYMAALKRNDPNALGFDCPAALARRPEAVPSSPRNAVGEPGAGIAH